MKKSIAFLGALLFGSVTFGQVTKNDSIKKPSSRKVSADDMKNFPVDTETTATDGHIKIESSQKHIKFNRTEKHTSDASAGKGSKIKGGVTQKGKVVESTTNATEKHPAETSAKNGEIALEKIPGRDKKNTNNKLITTEKQHYTVKLTNANKKANPDATEQTDNGNGEANTQKKHVANFKWSGLKRAKDTLPTPTSKSSDMFIKIGDIKGEKQSSNPISTFKGGAIQKSNATENETIIEKTPLIEKTGGSSSTQTTGSTDVFIKIGDIKGEKDDKRDK